MSHKDYYLTFHGYELGSPEAEQAWADKLDMMENPRKGPMVFVSQDIHYTSPIDGRPITSAAARADDLARSNCIPYDPEMRKDAERRQIESQAALEKSVDETVEREVLSMPSDKRERLGAELARGAEVEIERRMA